jgi:hypothetical protein
MTASIIAQQSNHGARYGGGIGEGDQYALVAC